MSDKLLVEHVAKAIKNRLDANGVYYNSEGLQEGEIRVDDYLFPSDLAEAAIEAMQSYKHSETGTRCNLCGSAYADSDMANHMAAWHGAPSKHSSDMVGWDCPYCHMPLPDPPAKTSGVKDADPT